MRFAGEMRSAVWQMLLSVESLLARLRVGAVAAAYLPQKHRVAAVAYVPILRATYGKRIGQTQKSATRSASTIERESTQYSRRRRCETCLAQPHDRTSHRSTPTRGHRRELARDVHGRNHRVPTGPKKRKEKRNGVSPIAALRVGESRY